MPKKITIPAALNSIITQFKNPLLRSVGKIIYQDTGVSYIFTRGDESECEQIDTTLRGQQGVTIGLIFTGSEAQSEAAAFVENAHRLFPEWKSDDILSRSDKPFVSLSKEQFEALIEKSRSISPELAGLDAKEEKEAPGRLSPPSPSESDHITPPRGAVKLTPVPSVKPSSAATPLPSVRVNVGKLELSVKQVAPSAVMSRNHQAIIFQFSDHAAGIKFESDLVSNGFLQAVINFQRSDTVCQLAIPLIKEVELQRSLQSYIAKKQNEQKLQRLIKRFLPQAEISIEEDSANKLVIEFRGGLREFQALRLASWYSNGNKLIIDSSASIKRFYTALNIEAIRRAICQIALLNSAVGSVVVAIDAQQVNITFSTAQDLQKFQRAIKYDIRLAALTQSSDPNRIQIPLAQMDSLGDALTAFIERRPQEVEIGQTIEKILGSSCGPITIIRKEDGGLFVGFGHEDLRKFQGAVKPNEFLNQLQFKYSEQRIKMDDAEIIRVFRQEFPEFKSEITVTRGADDTVEVTYANPADNAAFKRSTKKLLLTTQEIYRRQGFEVQLSDVALFQESLGRLQQGAGQVSPNAVSEPVLSFSQEADAVDEFSPDVQRGVEAASQAAKKQAVTGVVVTAATLDDVDDDAIPAQSAVGFGDSFAESIVSEETIRAKLRSVSYDAGNIKLTFSAPLDTNEAVFIQNLFQGVRAYAGIQEVSLSAEGTFTKSEKGKNALVAYIKERAEEKWLLTGNSKQHYLTRSIFSLFGCSRSDSSTDAVPDPYSRDAKLLAAAQALIYFCAHQQMPKDAEGLSQVFSPNVCRSMNEWCSDLRAAVKVCRA